jgi:hypothetical protein
MKDLNPRLSRSKRDTLSTELMGHCCSDTTGSFHCRYNSISITHRYTDQKAVVV